MLMAIDAYIHATIQSDAPPGCCPTPHHQVGRSIMESQSMVAGDAAAAKKRRRRLSSGGDSDSEFSANSSSSRSSSEESESTGSGASLTSSGVSKQKTRKRPKSKMLRASAATSTTGSAATTTVTASKDTSSDNETKTRKGQQQWTELTAVCHVFSDEVYKYIHPIVEEDVHQQKLQQQQRRKKKQPPHLSIGEKKQLNTLVERVKERVDRQSAVVLDNRKLVKAAKAAKCKVRALRNDIMITRLLSGKLEAEVLSLEKQARRRKGDQMKAEQASRFLSSIETLARRR